MYSLDYLSTVDISQPFGPSTNEYETVKYLIENCDSKIFIPKNDHELDLVNSVNVRQFEWRTKGILIPLIPLSVLFIHCFRRRKTPLIIRLDNAGIVWLVPILCRLIGRDYHLMHLQDPIEIHLRRKKKPKVLASLMKIVFYLIVRGSKSIETTQAEFYAHYKLLYPEKRMKVVPHGVDTAKFVLGRLDSQSCSKESVTIGYVGGFPLYKGGKEVIEVVNYLKGKGFQVNGLIVGDTKVIGEKSQADTLRSLASSYNLSEEITVTGYVSYSDVISYFQSIDIGLSLDITEELERRGNSSQKIYQYLACGCQIVIPKGTHPDLTISANVYECELDKSDLSEVIWGIIANKKAALSRESRQEAHDFVANHYSITAKFQKRFELWFN